HTRCLSDWSSDVCSSDLKEVRSNVSVDAPIPPPPFWGARVITRIRLDDVVECLDRNALYRLQWGAKNAKGPEWEALKGEFDAMRSEERRVGKEWRGVRGA